MTDIDAKLDALQENVSEIKDSIKTLTAAIVRLAVVEERLGNNSQALERAFANIEKVGQRVMDLEAQAVQSKQTNGWVEKGLWAAAAAACMYIAKKVGLIA